MRLYLVWVVLGGVDMFVRHYRAMCVFLFYCNLLKVSTLTVASKYSTLTLYFFTDTPYRNRVLPTEVVVSKCNTVYFYHYYSTATCRVEI